MVMFLYRGMAADIPESEAHVAVLDSLNVECCNARLNIDSELTIELHA